MRPRMFGVPGFLALGLVAAIGAPFGPSSPQTTEGNAAYQSGRRAIERGAWEEAIEAFEEAEEDAALADAALYWQAYAERRRGETARALELVAEIDSRFPQSEWRDDAQALAAEIRGATAGRTGQTPGGPNGSDELKLMALNALMQRDDDSALPVLEELLASSPSARVKERALFVLAQSDSERAHEILARVARGNDDPELQSKAIRYLGVHAGDRGLALLSELYSSLESVETRETVLESFMIAGQKERLLAVARDEPEVELRRKAIQLLGTMDARAELWELYGRETSTEAREQLLRAFMVSGDEAHLLAVARNPQESVELRKAAIHNLGVSGDSARPALLEIYRSESDRGLKEQVLHGLFIQDADADLVALARAETDPELQKRAVHWLSLMDSDAAKDFMMEILKR